MALVPKVLPLLEIRTFWQDTNQKRACQYAENQE